MLKFSPFQAPSRYVWKDPDTSHEFVATDKATLIQHIRNYRAQNGLEEIDYLDMAVDDYLCGLAENSGKCQGVKLKRGFFQYFSGGMSLVKNVFYGEKNMVEQEEAERRATICVGCPHNVFPDRDGFLYWSDRVAEASTGGRKTSRNGDLGNCELCTCPLKPKVFFKGPFKLGKEVTEKLPDFCWQRDE